MGCFQHTLNKVEEMEMGGWVEVGEGGQGTKSSPLRSVKAGLGCHL